MPQLDIYTRMRMFTLIQQGFSNIDIVSILKDENIIICRQTVWRFKKHFSQHKTISALPRSGRLSKSQKIFQIIETCMRKDDETTAQQLRNILSQKGIDVSLTTILRARKQLGWSYKGSAYCQMIREANRIKRLEWAIKHINDPFEDVIWTDETTIQLETHKRYCCRKLGEKPRCKPRAKHPAKVHIWAGISWNGRTKLCVFKGIMTAEVYVGILQQCLVPSINSLYPQRSCRFMQDNDPKHTSKKAQEFFTRNNINWWHKAQMQTQSKTYGMR